MIVRLAFVIAAMWSLLPLPAWADSDASTQGNEFIATSETTTAPSQTNVSDAGSASDDSYWAFDPMCVDGEGASVDAYYGCAAVQTCGVNGELNVAYLISGGQSTPAGTACLNEDAEAPPEVLTPGRILEALRRIPVPASPIGVNPVGGRTLVNFDTIFHTEAQPFTTTVTLFRRDVTFDITPSEFTWRTGQGDFTTTEPGREYRANLPWSAYITHRYLEAGKVDLGLETTWTARWRVGNGPWQPVDGTVTTSSPTVPLEIVTARPQLISYD